MFVTIIDKVDHDKAASTTDFAGRLDNGGLVKGRRVGIHRYTISPRLKFFKPPRMTTCVSGRLKTFFGKRNKEVRSQTRTRIELRTNKLTLVAFHIFIRKFVHASLCIVGNNLGKNPVGCTRDDVDSCQIVGFGCSRCLELSRLLQVFKRIRFSQSIDHIEMDTIYSLMQYVAHTCNSFSNSAQSDSRRLHTLSTKA